MKQSGLKEPIPGLVDMVRGGPFSDCSPYGKCWEPSKGSATESEPQAGTAIPQAQNAGATGVCNPAQAAGVRCEWVREDRGTLTVYEGPCGRGPQTQKHYWTDKLLKITTEHPEGEVVKQNWGMDFVSGGSALPLGHYPGWWRYPWVTCHAGSWLPEPRVRVAGCLPGKAGKCPQPRKRWVVGPKRKGGSFLRVKVGKGDGYIPKHPLDVTGKPPLNAVDGVLTFQGKGVKETAEIKATPKNLEIVKSLPAGYEASWAKNLPKVEKPVIQNTFLVNGTTAARLSMAQAENQKNQTVIRYDYKTRNFVELSNAGGGAQGKGRPVVIAHVGTNAGGGTSSHAGNTGGTSGSRGGSQTKGGGSSRGSSPAGGSPSHSSSSSGGGGASHASSSGGGGGGTSHTYSSGGAGESRGASQPSPAPAPAPAPTPAPSPARPR